MGGHLQPSRVVTQLVAALQLLADAPSAQLDWLARYLRDGRARSEDDFRLDELALQFEDAAQALPQFVHDGLVLPEQERTVAGVTEQLSWMRDISRAHLWRAAALASEAWDEVRLRATRALEALQVETRA